MPSAQRLFTGNLQGPFSQSPQLKGFAPAPTIGAHAANRLMFGPEPGDVGRIDSMGYEAFLAEQLDPTSIDDSDCDAKLAALPHDTLSEGWAQLYDRRGASGGEATRPINEVTSATWTRILHSKRQLHERMVEFWHNHFNVHGWSYIIRSMWPTWDAVMRKHALGNFRAFLEETAVNPCMLYYLDNYVSTNGGPNENYARELMELHTLGAMNYQVDGGFIDQDVYETSRCFTGWSFDTDGDSPTRGQFQYNHEDHDRFVKLVLGTIIPGDQAPMTDGRDVLDMVAYHPGTARHIAWKMAVRFIDDFPPQSIIDSTAAVFLENKYEPDQIKRTLNHLLLSDEFRNTRMTKFKRPLDWTASAMRALGIQFTTSSSFNYLYERMGMPMFGWRTPDGPPDFASHWATSNNLIQRWNWVFSIASEWYDERGLLIPTEGVVPPSENYTVGLTQWWVDRIMGRPVTDVTMNALREFVAEGRSWWLPMPEEQFESKSRYLAALICMTPEFMRR